MTLVMLSATSKYRVKIMNSRIVDMRRSFPLSDTFPKLQKKSNLDKLCKRYGWIYQLPRQHLPAATCEFIDKTATSPLFWEKVPSLPRIILRTRIRICRQFSQRDWIVSAVTTADDICGFNTPKWGFLSKLALWWFSSILKSIYIYLWDRVKPPQGQMEWFPTVLMWETTGDLVGGVHAVGCISSSIGRLAGICVVPVVANYPKMIG